MANWDKIREKGNIDDRRGKRVVKTAGGLTLSGILLILVVGYFGGQDQALNLASEIFQNTQNTQTTSNTNKFDGEDTYEIFASKVLGSNNSLWKESFKNSNLNYREPKLVLFRDYTHSSCAGASSNVGPHYCSADKTIYLDERFFVELKNKYGGTDEDVAQAYVIAHEVGHHIQGELGILSEAHNLMRKYQSEKNTYSIALELQADCFAGIWAGKIKGQGVLESGEIQEAIDAAKAVGDDHIQETFAGEIHPESWTHGSSADRKKWFLNGYKNMSFEKCDTFRKL